MHRERCWNLRVVGERGRRSRRLVHARHVHAPRRAHAGRAEQRVNVDVVERGRVDEYGVRSGTEIGAQVFCGRAIFRDANVQHRHRARAQRGCAERHGVRARIRRLAGRREIRRRRRCTAKDYRKTKDLIAEAVGDRVRVDLVAAGFGNAKVDREMAVGSQGGMEVLERAEIVRDHDHVQALGHVEIVVADRRAVRRLPQIELRLERARALDG